MCGLVPLVLEGFLDQFGVPGVEITAESSESPVGVQILAVDIDLGRLTESLRQGTGTGLRKHRGSDLARSAVLHRGGLTQGRLDAVVFQ
jgi:hypothetical protein